MRCSVIAEFDIGRVNIMTSSAGAPRKFVGVVACATLLGAGLAGCSVDTPLPQLRPDLPAHWHNAMHATTTASAPAPDLDSWWRAFDDAPRERSVRAGLEVAHPRPVPRPGPGEGVRRRREQATGGGETR